MSPEALAGFREYVQGLPVGTPVPMARETLLALLGPASVESLADVEPAPLTAAQLAGRYGRKPCTARLWLEQGLLPGAYKLRGREWRIPVSALIAFEQRGGAGAPPADTGADAGSADLSAWRKAS